MKGKQPVLDCQNNALINQNYTVTMNHYIKMVVIPEYGFQLCQTVCSIMTTTSSRGTKNNKINDQLYTELLQVSLNI